VNTLSTLIKCCAAGFLLGIIASNSAEINMNLFDLTGAIVIICVAFVLREMTNLKRVAGTDEVG
jgi:hypothetical protein